MSIPTTAFRQAVNGQLYPATGDGYVISEVGSSLKAYVRKFVNLESDASQEPDWEKGFSIDQSPALILGPTTTPAEWETHALHELAASLLIEGHIRTGDIREAEKYQWLIMRTLMHGQEAIRSAVTSVKMMKFGQLEIQSYRTPGQQFWRVVPIIVTGILSVNLRA